MSIRVTDHALLRYRERVNPSGTQLDILRCIESAKERDLRRLRRGKSNTTIIKTGCCFFICSRDAVVSAVKELRTQRP